MKKRVEPVVDDLARGDNNGILTCRKVVRLDLIKDRAIIRDQWLDPHGVQDVHLHDDAAIVADLQDVGIAVRQL